MNTNTENIPGWGADLDPKNRPGVPQRKRGSVPPAPDAWPAKQAGADVEIHPPDSPPTPVFGTGVPLKRVMPSGWTRRLAYRIPQDKAEHWMLLILGDRLDVWEHRLKPIVLGAAAIAGVAFLAGLARGGGIMPPWRRLTATGW